MHIRYILEFKDRLRITRKFHKSNVGGHKGNAKTVARILCKYFWENIKVENLFKPDVPTVKRKN